MQSPNFGCLDCWAIALFGCLDWWIFADLFCGLVDVIPLLVNPSKHTKTKLQSYKYDNPKTTNNNNELSTWKTRLTPVQKRPWPHAATSVPQRTCKSRNVCPNRFKIMRDGSSGAGTRDRFLDCWAIALFGCLDDWIFADVFYLFLIV